MMAILGSVRRAALMAGVAAAFALSGCASTGGGAGGAGSVGVEVNNDLQPPTAITVHAQQTDGGARRLVGNVSPGSMRRLSFNPSAGGQYVLIARTTGGREIVSNPITLSAGDSVRWNLSSNLVTGQ